MFLTDALPPLPPAAALVVIDRNYGGRVLDFGRTVQGYLDQKSQVRVEGDCASACTMVTAVPTARLCFGPQASLSFHQAFTPASDVVVDPDVDVRNRSDEASSFMAAFYPKRLKRWLSRHGGLTAEMLVLKGAELRSLFRTCR